MPIFKCVRIPSLSALYFEDGRLPDVGSDYTWIPCPRRHSWTREQKQVLYVLSSHYKNPSIDLWRVFKARFARSGHLPRRKSWDTMRNYNSNPTRYRAWWSETAGHRLRVELQTLASSISIQLLPKAQGTSPTNYRRRGRRPYLCSRTNTSVSNDEWDSSESTSLASKDPGRKLFGEPATPRACPTKLISGLLTPPPTHSRGVPGSVRADIPNTIRDVPPLAFRAFNSQSQGLNSIEGFVAGSFVSMELSAIPKLPNEGQYLKELDRHLARNHSGPTPFISLCHNLMRVIHHAMRRCQESGTNQLNDWNITVISLAKVRSSVRAVWDLDAGIHSRKAFGEWVVYGSIESSCVLSVVAIAQLLEVMSRTRQPFYIDILQSAKWTSLARKSMSPSVRRRLGHDDGLSLGHLLLLLGVPVRHLEATTSHMLLDWRYPEYKNEAWKSNKEFVRGRDEAFKSASQHFRELRDTKQDLQTSELAVLSDRLLQSVDNMHDYYPKTNILTQHSMSGGTTFAKFLDELETAASINTQLDDPPIWNHADTVVDDTSGLMLQQEETPGWGHLDPTAECLEGWKVIL